MSVTEKTPDHYLPGIREDKELDSYGTHGYHKIY